MQHPLCHRNCAHEDLFQAELSFLRTRSAQPKSSVSGSSSTEAQALRCTRGDLHFPTSFEQEGRGAECPDRFSERRECSRAHTEIPTQQEKSGRRQPGNLQKQLFIHPAGGRKGGGRETVNKNEGGPKPRRKCLRVETRLEETEGGVAPGGRWYDGRRKSRQRAPGPVRLYLPRLRPPSSCLPASC